MDLVYQLSKHPVALLGRPLQMETELHLLARILSGNLVDGDPEFRLSATTAPYDAREALLLLYEITHDRWWGGAWTFQENYRGREHMRLLIRHDPLLEQQKLLYGMFGKLLDEVCVKSVTFLTEATRLCLALRRELHRALGLLPPDEVHRIESVLRAAGRYTLMLHESSAMTPTVIADIEVRDLSESWDRLPIIANCCQYSVRLDGEVLGRQRRSLSVSTLAMCLVNGEILNNGNDDMISATNLTVSEFTKRYMFQAFNAPEDDTRRLTFNKGCRLTDVELTAEGTATKGHLWKLDHVVDTASFKRKLPWVDKPHGRLTLTQRKRLRRLVLHLSALGYSQLAARINKHLDIDAHAHAGKGYASFTEKYLHRMAVELVAAIRARRKLMLGSIWDPTGQSAPYRAIFVWSGEGGDGVYLPPAFVFTSVRQGKRGSQAHLANDIDHHVSLEVDLEEPLGGGVPFIRVRNWIHGMYFFDGCPRTRVVFPWPPALLAIQP